MFIAALFTIARSWKQPKCPSTDKWYIYTMEYYSAIKRNEIGSFVEMRMDLGTVIQSEVHHKEKNKYRMLTCICGIGLEKLFKPTPLDHSRTVVGPLKQGPPTPGYGSMAC